jgi:Flp pilus assembly protein TadG
MVEFALALTILIMLFLGIYVFARGYNIYETITRAAREGARMAVLPTSVASGNQNTYISYASGSSTYSMPGCSAGMAGTSSPNTDTFNDFIAPALRASSLNPAQVSNYVECTGWMDPNDTQCGVTISYSYPYQLNIPFTTLRYSTIYLHTDVTMRLENTGFSQNSDGSYTATCP